MRISRINFYSINNNKERNVVDSFRTTFQQYDTVSFSSICGDGKKMKKMFKNIHCPCCGIMMLSAEEVQKITVALANAPVQKILTTLQTYTSRMHNVEHSVFLMLKKLNKQYPDYTIPELLNTQRNTALKELYLSETAISEVLSGIREIADYCHNNKIHEILNDAEALLADKNTHATFKRKAFIAKMTDAVCYMKNKNAAKKIIDIANQLPYAGADKNAFIIKYTGKNSMTGKDRTSKEIIHALLAPSVATIEHVKAQSPNVKNGGGIDYINNYLLECARDNNLRDGMLFSDFVKQNPQFFGKHLQQYIDEIIFRINNARLRGFEKYPMQIAKTLYKQSKGQINLDISNCK